MWKDPDPHPHTHSRTKQTEISDWTSCVSFYYFAEFNSSHSNTHAKKNKTGTHIQMCIVSFGAQYIFKSTC